MATEMKLMRTAAKYTWMDYKKEWRLIKKTRNTKYIGQNFEI
jgi:hypothetical protein